MTLIKSLNSDFVVRELDLQGNIDNIIDESDPLAKEFAPFLAFLSPEFKIPEIDFTPIQHILLPEDFENVKSFINTFTPNTKIEFPSPLEKLDRTVLHNFIKSLQIPTIESTTKDTSFQISIHSKIKPPKIPTKQRYLHFTMLKNSLDTNAALAQLTKSLPFYAKYFQTKDFSYNGIKDKRGVTTQRICVKNKDSWPQFFLSAAAQNHEISVGNFEFSDELLNLNQHSGNEFEVVFRKAQPGLLEALASVQEDGFSNKFGPQRFGSCSIKTDEIGEFIVKNDFISALKSIVVNSVETSRNYTSELFENLQNLDEKFKKSIEFVLGGEFVRDGGKIVVIMKERQVLDDLSNSEARNILETTLPRNLQTFYFHAWQSKIFNDLCVEFDQNELRVGDIVQGKCGKIVSVNEDNIEIYTKFDKVAPLVGFSSYRENIGIFTDKGEIQQKITEILEQKGLKLQEFPQFSRNFLAPGSWRKMRNNPVKIQVCIKEHSDIMQEFEINGREFVDIEKNKMLESEGNVSVIAKFKLDKSVYATELIGQVLGEEYDQDNQKQLMIQYGINE